MSVSNAGLAVAYSPAGYAAQNKQNGKGFIKDVKKFANNVNDKLQETKIISKLAYGADILGVPHASKVEKIANKLGYGKKIKKSKK
jgi:hypothetical protein